MIRLETIHCPLCGKQQEQFLFKKDGYTIVQCQNCHLIYVNPRMTPEESARFYNKNIISPLPYYQKTEREDRKTFIERLRHIERYLPHKGKLLDIGCTIGTFLHEAKERGWECYGIEINKKAAALCKKKGLSILASTVDELKGKEHFFDVIVMSDVIEHIHDPKALLEKVNKLLKKEGLLAISTPDVGSIAARVLGKLWHHVKPEEHLLYFSKATLENILKRYGFEIIAMDYGRRYYAVETIITKPEPFARFTKKGINIAPTWIRRQCVPFNLWDQLWVIAKKR